MTLCCVDLDGDVRQSREILQDKLGHQITGSMDDFYKTSNFVSAVENRQGLKIACLEEIAFNNNWITKKNIKQSIKFYGNCDYSKYLSKLL